MSDPLTRTEILHLVLNRKVFAYDIGARILETDAALRAQLIELENDKAFLVQERLTLLEAFARLAAEVNLANEKQAQRQVVALTAQLAQARRAVWEEVGGGGEYRR